MKRALHYIAVFLILWYLLGGLVGCAFEKKRFPPYSKKIATFWDGIWHGIIFFELPKSVTKTEYYRLGCGIGVVYIFLSMTFFSGTLSNQYGEPGCIVCYLFGLLSGTVLYWSIYGIVKLIEYLGGSIGMWLKWLVRTVTGEA